MSVDLDTVFAKLSVEDERLRILNLMELLGFDTIHVNYSGGGDSGSVDNVEFFPTPTSKSQKDAAKFIEKRFEEPLSQPIWDKHGSFADGGGFSVNGIVVWDAKQKMVDINGTDHYWEYDEEGEESDSSEEEWGEGVYEFDEDDQTPSQNYSYDCLSAYAQFVLKDQFPGEYHNRIVAGAIQGDKQAKEYVKWVEGGKT